MTQPPEQYRHVTAREAEEQLNVPASTVRAWASQGRLHAVSIDAKGRRWYRLSDVLALRDSTRRRGRHTRPNRARCSDDEGHIA
jgi:DNA-binding transcriptional MerR regulator